nr:hypothetical protein [Tanacetum cinerariifolium]GFB83734.1 hypothetical protein [Tanacetum cinerariifolium]
MGMETSGTNSEMGKTDIANKDDRNVNLGTSGVTDEKLNQKNGKISSKVTDDSEGKILKNSKDGGFAKFPDNKKLGNNGSCSAKLLGNKKLGNSGSGKDLVANPSLDKGKEKSELALDSTVNNKGSKQEQSSKGKIIKKLNNDGYKNLPDNKKLGNSSSGKDLVANYTLAKGKAKSRIALDSIANNKESNEEQSSEGKIIKVQRMMVLQNGQIISNRAIAVAGKIW